MTSIIIPAHNEENVIERCLRPFKRSIDNKEVEVIVVCNGCTDQTANRVSVISDRIKCIETDTASKANALNIGDSAANFFPRFYIDADISISMEAISAISKALECEYLAASPEVQMDLSASSWPVKAYYDVWFSLPYCKTGMVGAGVYALSCDGRGRFNKFPEIISDDGFVRCLFKEYERGFIHGYYSIVKAPSNLSDLIKIKTRSRLGRYELKDKFTENISNEEKHYISSFLELMLDIKMWPKIFLYLAINLYTMVSARWQIMNNMLIWERDISSRSI